MSRRKHQTSKKAAGAAVHPEVATGAPPISAADSISRKEKLAWAGILLALYAFIATWGQFDFSDLMGYYNAQADGFMAGHLYIEQRPSQGMLMDMVPFEDHYYLQWGPFPALLHMLPRMIGLSLSDRVACLLAGWLAALVFLKIMLILQRGWFPALPKWVVQCFFVAFAFATPAAIVALRGTIYHESIAWAMLFVLFAFLALLKYIETQSFRWVLLSGIGMALAVMTRISLAPYAAGLLGGFAAFEWRQRKGLPASLGRMAAFAAPVAAAGLLMMGYNYARFHSAFEYGMRYVPVAAANKPAYALDRIPENFRHYVLAPIKLSWDYPWFTHEGWKPFVKTERAEDMSSMFLASPFLLLGVLAWRLFRSTEARVAPIKIFAVVAAGSAAVVFFSLLCFVGTSRRYMQDFTPMLMVLAFLGMATFAKEGAGWNRWRAPCWTVVAICALLHLHLIFTQQDNWAPLDRNVSKTFVVFSPLVRRLLPGHGLDARDGIHHNEIGLYYANRRQYPEAIRHFEQARRFLPHSPYIQRNLQYAKELEGASGQGQKGNAGARVFGN